MIAPFAEKKMWPRVPCEGMTPPKQNLSGVPALRGWCSVKQI
jgi:hypothetical protein